MYVEKRDFRERRIAEGNSFIPKVTGVVYDETSFWSKWYSDLDKARHSIVIVSPFVWPEAVQRNLSSLKRALERRVEVTIYMRRVGFQRPKNKEALDMLCESNVSVVQSEKSLHQKLAIIDQRIVWEGSLNILSHVGSMEHMRRFNSHTVVAEVQNAIKRIVE